MSSLRGALRVPCFCDACKKHPNGFVYQTKQLVKKHLRKAAESSKAAARPAAVSTIERRRLVFPDFLGHRYYNSCHHEDHFRLQVFFHDNRLLEDHRVLLVYHHGRTLSRASSHVPSRRVSLNLNVETFVPSAPNPDPDPWVDREDRQDRTLRHAIPAMQEKTYVRMAYLKAVLANVFGHLSWERATNDLNALLNILAAAGVLPEEPAPVQTLQSARKRLGIDPDEYIIQYALCPLCWEPHTPDELEALSEPTCMLPCCNGQIYTMKNGACIPNLIQPQVSIIQSLRRMFKRPGFCVSVVRRESHIPNPSEWLIIHSYAQVTPESMVTS
ncbi:hypothetical protein H2248_003622 [Termitomyces sp. 'cryptogamus']|nr:hypothetical protein H2248_003622 [Termitomyces sp. 'cryptogamus']